MEDDQLSELIRELWEITHKIAVRIELFGYAFFSYVFTRFMESLVTT